MKARGTDVVVSNMGSALAPKPFSASAIPSPSSPAS